MWFEAVIWNLFENRIWKTLFSPYWAACLTSGPLAKAGPVFLPRIARRARAPPSGPSWLPRPRATLRRVSLSRARTRPTALRHSVPRGGHMPATPAGWRPVAPLTCALVRLQADRSAPPTSLLHSLRPLTAATAEQQTSVPAMPAHHWPPHLRFGSASPSRSTCSHPPAVVRPPPTGIARRSWALLVGGVCSVDLALSLPLSPRFRAHSNPFGLPVLRRRSPRHTVAGGLLPPVSRATEPPWSTASSIASFSGLATDASVFALARWSRWWWPHRWQPRRRRDPVGQPRALLGFDWPMGSVDPSGPACLSQCVRACTQPWVALALFSRFQKRIYEMDFQKIWK
jgi:hypothetical protein